MNTIFGDFISNGILLYLNDIIIYSKTKKKNLCLVEEVLSRMRKHDFYLKPSKCFFFVSQAVFLGFKLSPGKIQLEPYKTLAILEWERSRTFRELAAFMGFINFSKHFAEHLAEIVAPLNAMEKGKTKENLDDPLPWDEEKERAFWRVKKAFCAAPQF